MFVRWRHLTATAALVVASGSLPGHAVPTASCEVYLAAGYQGIVVVNSCQYRSGTLPAVIDLVVADGVAELAVVCQTGGRVLRATGPQFRQVSYLGTGSCNVSLRVVTAPVLAVASVA